ERHDFLASLLAITAGATAFRHGLLVAPFYLFLLDDFPTHTGKVSDEGRAGTLEVIIGHVSDDITAHAGQVANERRAGALEVVVVHFMFPFLMGNGWRNRVD